jgi:hypothetical protein
MPFSIVLLIKRENVGQQIEQPSDVLGNGDHDDEGKFQVILITSKNYL